MLALLPVQPDYCVRLPDRPRRSDLRCPPTSSRIHQLHQLMTRHFATSRKRSVHQLRATDGLMSRGMVQGAVWEGFDIVSFPRMILVTPELLYVWTMPQSLSKARRGGQPLVISPYCNGSANPRCQSSLILPSHRLSMHSFLLGGGAWSPSFLGTGSVQARSSRARWLSYAPCSAVSARGDFTPSRTQPVVTALPVICVGSRWCRSRWWRRLPGGCLFCTAPFPLSFSLGADVALC